MAKLLIDKKAIPLLLIFLKNIKVDNNKNIIKKSKNNRIKTKIRPKR